MKEIGGYIEFEYNHGKMLHDDGIKLESGRSCLAYLIRARNIKKIALPLYMCDSVFEVCERYGVEMRFYRVGYDFLPKKVEAENDEYFYLMNYYGQLDQDTITAFRDKFPKLIVDNTQDYFAAPVEGVDTIYTCRKYFGVSDGAILYTDVFLEEALDRSESFRHMNYLLGRFERTGSEFFEESIENNRRLSDQPIKTMSKLTENLLRGIDYEMVRKRRTDNYLYLHEKLKDVNRLELRPSSGAFMYPLLGCGGEKLRRKLIEQRVYIPQLWPNVLESADCHSVEYSLAKNILPLPCDQRYGVDEMEYMSSMIGDYYG